MAVQTGFEVEQVEVEAGHLAASAAIAAPVVVVDRGRHPRLPFAGVVAAARAAGSALTIPPAPRVDANEPSSCTENR